MNNKNILTVLFGCALLLGGTTACTPDYQTDFKKYTLVVPDNSLHALNFNKEGGNAEIEVQTNVDFDNWHASSDVDWCKLEKKEGKVLVTIEPNTIYVTRQAHITVNYGHQSYTVNIFQVGSEPAILIGDNDKKQDGTIVESTPDAKTAKISVLTNLKLDNVIVPDTCNWVHFDGVEEPASSRAAENTATKILKFNLDQNKDTIARFCKVIIQSSQNYAFTGSFIIKQKKSGVLVETTQDEFLVEASGKTLTIPVQTNGPANPYTVTIAEDAQSWIHLAPATRAMRDANLTVTIDPSIQLEKRTGLITLTPSDKSSSKTIKIIQDEFIPVPPSNVVSAKAVKGDVPGTIVLTWEKPEKVDYTKITITYFDPVFKENKTIELSNTALRQVIKNTFEVAGEYTFTITTYGPTGMATESPIQLKSLSSKATIYKIALDGTMIKANATQDNDGQGIPALFDNKKNTFYHSLWGHTAKGNKLHFLQFSLEEGINYVTFDYWARQNGQNNPGDIKRADIYVSDTDTNVEPDSWGSWTKVGTINFELPTENAGLGTHKEWINFSKPYKFIRLVPVARRSLDPLDPTNKDKAWFNLSQIFMYTHGTMTEEEAKAKMDAQ